MEENKKTTNIKQKSLKKKVSKMILTDSIIMYVFEFTKTIHISKNKNEKLS